jgi:transposase InsO family protein
MHQRLVSLLKRDLLYRVHENKNNGVKVMQIMVPLKFRERVMKVAHDGLLSGHFGNRKTLERISAHFYFPGIHETVKRYVWSCDICQRNISKGRVVKCPMGKLPLIGIPFQFLSLDIIGPIVPATERGNKFILTLIDMCSRYPEAVALKDVSTTTVADALLDIYSRIGIPKRIHHDNGSQFVSNIMQEVNKLLSIKATTSTAYHPMGNSVIENWNKSLKNALKKMTSERVRDWDRYLSPLLFAMRDTPHDSTTFSSFELIYGRPIRGPMSILKELWTNEEDEGETKTVYQYVIDLREKIEQTCQIAKEQLAKVQDKNMKYYNRKAKVKDLKVGDLALLLLPMANNKLQLQWRGPYEVVGRIGQVDYQIKLPTGKVKTFHGNMLKKYYQREKQDDIIIYLFLWQPIQLDLKTVIAAIKVGKK